MGHRTCYIYLDDHNMPCNYCSYCDLIFQAIFGLNSLYWFVRYDTGFNLTAKDYGLADTYHLLAEISRHGSALRTYMSDDAFTDTSQVYRVSNVL